MNKSYFPITDETVNPLRHTVSRRVRFEEVDALGIVWHGRYPSYFEDARAALGERFGIGYKVFYSRGILAPIKIIHIDYHLPLTFDEQFTIEAVLHWTEAARLNCEYFLYNQEGKITTTGYTVQLMLDSSGEVLIIPPPFYREFTEQWKGQTLQCRESGSPTRPQ